MDKQNQMPLFYSNPVPLDGKAHADWGLRDGFGLGFTSGVNAVPINLIEMPQVCHHYPIAFSPDGNGTPVAILGLRDNENLFLTDDLGWKAQTYIPAYIRRYPFIFSELPDGEQLTLCVDQVDNIVGPDKDFKFFETDGSPSQLSNNALEFCKSYHAAAQQTIEFSRKIIDSNLLVERQAQIKIAGSKVINFSGFGIIDEAAFAKLPSDTFLEFRENGWLPFVYAHLFSGSTWSLLTEMLNARMIERGEASANDTESSPPTIPSKQSDVTRSTSPIMDALDRISA